MRETKITRIDLVAALKSIHNDESPRNDDLTKEHFQVNLKVYFINCLK